MSFSFLLGEGWICPSGHGSKEPVLSRGNPLQKKEHRMPIDWDFTPKFDSIVSTLHLFINHEAQPLGF